VNADPFTDQLHRFCEGLSEKIVVCAEHADDQGAREVISLLLDAIREAMANLMLCELECERILRHG
jgi:hypothetical protein